MAPQEVDAEAGLALVAPPAVEEESAFRKFRKFRRTVRKTRHPLAQRVYGGVAGCVLVAALGYFAYLGEVPTFHGYHDAFANPAAGHARLLSSDLSCKTPLGLHTEFPARLNNITYTKTLTEDEFNAEKEPYQNGSGIAILYLLGCLYIFIGIGIVCDYFFEPALEAISEALALSPDVAGATFMAAGSSAPELFTSVGDTFGTGNNIGVGTILGSAMFNILVIIAVSAMYAGQELEVDWVPVARDVTFYSISVGLLVIFFLTGDMIEWWEGFIMVMGYMVYIVYMMFNAKIHAKCEKPKEEKVKKKLNRSMTRKINKDRKDAAASAEGEKTKSKMMKREHSRAKVMMKMRDAENMKNSGSKVAPAPTNDPSAQTSASESGAAPPAEEEEEESLWEWPDTTAGQVLFVMSVPFNAAFTITIPDCSSKRFEKWYPLTFFMCIAWLAILCAAMAQLGTGIGCIWNIDPLVMGILLLAIGTSVPDAMASMIVAKAGEGGMAIANAIGSNVFDILLGLGLPWFIYGLVPCDAKKQIRPSNGEDVGKCVIFRAEGGNMFVDLAILYGTVGLFVAAMISTKWKMNNQLAKMLLAMYVVYITYQIISAKFL